MRSGSKDKSHYSRKCISKCLMDIVGHYSWPQRVKCSMGWWSSRISIDSGLVCPGIPFIYSDTWKIIDIYFGLMWKQQDSLIEIHWYTMSYITTTMVHLSELLGDNYILTLVQIIFFIKPSKGRGYNSHIINHNALHDISKALGYW